MRVAVVGVFLGCATVGLASPQQVIVTLFEHKNEKFFGSIIKTQSIFFTKP
jgi:hypothetical protein